MYVGEGEKNARAVFSLARKLAPCVVFMDEVDAVLDARDAGRAYATKREILNEFMAEWDGVVSKNEGVVVVGATNRPFDLDDAVLRRMPRRIHGILRLFYSLNQFYMKYLLLPLNYLVDLPTEKEREKILRILLKDERIDANVNIGDISAKTPLYSGSDLKNLCISAALHAVRDHLHLESGSSSLLNDHGRLNVFPELSSDGEANEELIPHERVLLPEHFEKAMKEVTSSLSEDQESLERLRRWDRVYGDGAGIGVARKTMRKFGFQQ